MTNNMKAIELNDEQLALVAGGHGGSYNQSNTANVWQDAQANNVFANTGDANNNHISDTYAYNWSSIWQKNVKKI